MTARDWKYIFGFDRAFLRSISLFCIDGRPHCLFLFPLLRLHRFPFCAQLPVWYHCILPHVDAYFLDCFHTYQFSFSFCRGGTILFIGVLCGRLRCISFTVIFWLYWGQRTWNKDMFIIPPLFDLYRYHVWSFTPSMSASNWLWDPG